MMDCDVLVVGAGPAGCAAAIRTAGSGLSTVMLDRRRPARLWAGESLPPGMTRLMHSVFGAGCLSEDRHRLAFGVRSAWGSEALIETDFLANPLGEGWLLDRTRFDADAREAAAAAGVTIVPDRRIVSLLHDRQAWRVDLDDRRRLTARFLVDATGRAGAVLRKLGIGRVVTDRQVAFIATSSDDGDAYAGTTVEAAPEGWWYTTPLPGGRRVIAYLTDHDLWREGSRDWHALLAGTRHIQGCAGSGAMSAIPRACPAGAARTEHLAGGAWLAVGDAAAAFDPLSSQGVATAVLMGSRAGNAIASPDRSRAVEAWTEAYAMLVAEHADLRTYYARLETRWPGSVFWRRRRQPEAAVASPLPAWLGSDPSPGQEPRRDGR
jgi:flavin-dependent dehydrogenase